MSVATIKMSSAPNHVKVNCGSITESCLSRTDYCMAHSRAEEGFSEQLHRYYSPAVTVWASMTPASLRKRIRRIGGAKTVVTATMMITTAYADSVIIFAFNPISAT